MSAAENSANPAGGGAGATGPPRRWRRRDNSVTALMMRGTVWLIAGLLLLIAVTVGGFWWYSTTPGFQQRLNREVVLVLEGATGGRVELHGLSFSLWHLAVEADGLVIHGLEGPGEAPYFSAEKIQVRVKILSFFQHATGTGIASHIGLDLLRVERPEFHLIVYKDGTTNQPAPKHPAMAEGPLQDTLLDLKAKEMELVHGVALLNDRAVPFDVAARDVEAQVHYLSTSDRYGIAVQMRDLQTKMKTQPAAQSRLLLEGELGRDIAAVKSFEFDSGKASVLRGTATLKDFAKPDWQAAVKGTLELRQVSVLTGFEGLTGGSVDLTLNGHSCSVAPVAAQTRRYFWRRRRAPTPTNPAKAQLAPSPACQEGYLLAGSAKVHGAGYENPFVRLHDVDGGAQLHITPSELLLTALTGYLPGGGGAAGELRIENWLGEAPAGTAAKVAPAHATLAAKVDQIPLRTIMEITEPHGYGDLGLDTAVSGPVTVEWGGPAADVSDTVQVGGDIKFQPTGVQRAGALDNVPVTGEAIAHYDGSKEVVNIQSVVLETPQSSLEASGVLGVNEGDPLTSLRADMIVRDLGEYDQLLQTLGFAANGKKGTAAIPVALHGAVVFHGSVAGRAADLDVKGHVQGTNIEVKLDNELDTQIDSLVADAEYSFDSGLAITDSTVERGTAVLNVSGTLRPRREFSGKGVETYVWDGGTAVNANLKLANADLTNVLQIVGQQKKMPVTGKAAASAHVEGTLDDLNGQGTVSLKDGVAYGEPYESAAADLSVHGQDFEASQVVLMLHGSQITGNGGYDLTTRHLHGHLQASNLVLAKFQSFRRVSPNANATLSVVADADGTLEQPGLKASAQLAGISAGGKALGSLSAEAHSEGSNLIYTAQSTLVGTKVEASGETQLTGGYQTQAKLVLSGFNMGTVIALVGSSGVTAQSSISGVVNLSGPLQTPSALTGSAELDQFDVKLQGVELKSVGPLRVGLRNGLATLDQIHITGEDTNLQASGTMQVFGATGPEGGKIDVKANGSVSVAIAHTFDPDILSSGKVEFTIAAGGEILKPSLTGRVKFDNVNMAVEGIPNGLSALNGTLVFNQDRLQVESLTATTGGGQLKVGGFLTYSHGLYADLTATGDVVRVRLYGLSTTANMRLQLQGSLQNMLLSGDVLITRFGVGPDLDFAAFSSVGGLSIPPPPNAPSNKIQLNVRVTSSPQLDFQNSYAKLAGTVDLTVRGTVAEPTLLGRIQITEGSATFAGTKYELQRGDIYFSNPVRIDPSIDIDATAHVENYDITIGLQGTLSNLKPTYRSEPPLSEADIFALLALGRTQEEAQIYQEQQVQQGANPTTSALLGGALNATVSNRIGKLFGGGTVKIDPAFVGTLGNSSARITIQKQITRQLSVTYATNVNYTAEQLLQAQYDLTPNSSIVVTRDETGVYSVVYKIRRRYR